MKSQIFLLLLSLHLGAHACTRKRVELFPDFFKQFSESKSFSVSRTVYPLAVLRFEDEADEAGRASRSVETRYLSRTDDLAAPGLNHYIRQNAFQVLRQEIKPNEAVVEIGKKDTDWLLAYHFVRQGKCWYLKRIENPSL